MDVVQVGATHSARARGVPVALTLLAVVGAGAARETVLFDKTMSLAGVTAQVTERKDAAPIRTVTVVVRAPDGRLDSISEKTPDRIVDAWLADLTRDGSVAVIIAKRSEGTGAYGSLAIFVWTGAILRRREVAGLSGDQARGYMGHDRYSLDAGRIVRAFPVYGPNDPNCCPTGGTRHLVYDQARNRWLTLSGRVHHAVGPVARQEPGRYGTIRLRRRGG